MAIFLFSHAGSFVIHVPIFSEFIAKALFDSCHELQASVGSWVVEGDLEDFSNDCLM